MRTFEGIRPGYVSITEQILFVHIAQPNILADAILMKYADAKYVLHLFSRFLCHYVSDSGTQQIQK